MRKTKYNKSLCTKLVDHMTNGYTFKSFGKTIGVTHQTLLNWVKEFPEFAEAKEEGDGALEYFVDTLIAEGASGKRKVNAQLVKLMAVNIKKWQGTMDGEDVEKKINPKSDIKINLAYDPRNKPKDEEDN